MHVCVPLQTTASRHGTLEGSNIVVIKRGQHTGHSRTRGLAQAERLRDDYRCSFLLASALIHSWYRKACTQSSALVVVVIAFRATVCCCFFVWWLDGTKSASIEVVQSNAISQHTQRRRRSGLAQPERLREGYRYSVPSGGQPPGIRSWKIGESRLGV